MAFIQATASVVLAVGIGEGLKIVRQLIHQEELKAFPLGGFVSTHATAVSALFLATYLETGLSVPLLICGVFGGIVLRDAFGVRWEVTKHSEALNKLTKSKLYLKTGHEKQEVLLGVLLGLAVTAIIYWIF